MNSRKDGRKRREGGGREPRKEGRKEKRKEKEKEGSKNGKKEREEGKKEEGGKRGKKKERNSKRIMCLDIFSTFVIGVSLGKGLRRIKQGTLYKPTNEAIIK